MNGAIRAFNEIRDIPYHIALNGEQGSDCGDKAKMLVEKLGELGFCAYPIIGFFRWSDTFLPAEVLSVPHDNECSHMFVEIVLDKNNRIFVDPTWNKELGKAGFRIAEWDGRSSTELAVPCHKILSKKESDDFIENFDYEGDLARSGEFYREFNKYCDSFLANS